MALFLGFQVNINLCTGSIGERAGGVGEKSFCEHVPTTSILLTEPVNKLYVTALYIVTREYDNIVASLLQACCKDILLASCEIFVRVVTGLSSVLVKRILQDDPV